MDPILQQLLYNHYCYGTLVNPYGSSPLTYPPVLSHGPLIPNAQISAAPPPQNNKRPILEETLRVIEPSKKKFRSDEMLAPVRSSNMPLLRPIPRKPVSAFRPWHQTLAQQQQRAHNFCQSYRSSEEIPDTLNAKVEKEERVMSPFAVEEEVELVPAPKKPCCKQHELAPRAASPPPQWTINPKALKKPKCLPFSVNWKAIAKQSSNNGSQDASKIDSRNKSSTATADPSQIAKLD